MAQMGSGVRAFDRPRPIAASGAGRFRARSGAAGDAALTRRRALDFGLVCTCACPS